MNARLCISGSLAAALLIGGVTLAVHRRTSRLPAAPVHTETKWKEVFSPLTVWPWPATIKETMPGHVTHWQDRSSPDGTLLDLFDFDFGRDPDLRLEIFDQDQDDAHPFDDKAVFWERGVGQITRQLNAYFQKNHQGRVVFACNGLFFGPNRFGAGATGEHVAPVVLAVKAHYVWGNHRWTFGVQREQNRTVFKTVHLPAPERLSREFDWAAGGAQCLIFQGRPLKLQPFPQPGQPKLKTPVPSTPNDAGHIPTVDFIKTSRVSLAWSRDNRHFYLLFVQDPDTESSSAIQFRHGLPMRGGWSLADLQRFWQSVGVWGAINSDGGDMAQMTYLREDGSYLLAPPMISGSIARRIVSPRFESAPAGGSLMYFYIRQKVDSR